MPAEPTLDPGPTVTEHSVIFRLADLEHEHAAVRLYQEVRVPGDRLAFAHDGTSWVLELDRPDVDRMEYLFQVIDPDGSHRWVTDPANPLRVPGVFGEKSVLEFSGYRPPAWLARPGPPGRRRELTIGSRSLTDTLPVTLWAPGGLDDRVPAPLLLVHDGPEYDELAQLTTYLSALIAARRIPPVRAALLAPGPRDDWYSADGAYTRALCLAVLPHLKKTVATTRTIGMGASLGAIAMLHAHRGHAAAFDALFLQSGSYFHARHDAHERRFSHYDRVVRAVDTMLRAKGHRDPVPVVLTCGEIEENVENNRIMARALRAQGYDVALHEVRDVHNYVAWRDAFDPHLSGLLRGEPPCATPS